ncbi:hypothetical protein H0H93_004891 [Arthromyces matolae]|nr:hypothetical protein H0H93_004891 [Arthromyces matolae]
MLDAIPFPTEIDYDVAAQLLFQFCPDDIKKDPALDLNSPESFAVFLYRNSDIYRTIQKAKSSQVFTDYIWKRCKRYEHGPYIPPDHFRHPVEPVLQNIVPKMKQLVSGEAPELVWSLDDKQMHILPDITQVDLSYFRDKTQFPVMLFHELGGFRLDEKLNNRIQGLFKRGRNTFLVNASATGKTRLVYEGLCQYWGFYITAHADYEEACALETALGPDFEDTERDLVRGLPKKTALGFEQLLAKNKAIAERRFSAALLAHLLIFRDFLEAAHIQDGEITEKQRRRWLYAQLKCKLLAEENTRRTDRNCNQQNRDLAP